jgi:hypothetical protein
MQVYTSKTNHYKIIIDDEVILVENPDIIEEVLENDVVIYISQVRLAWPTKDDVTVFQGIHLTRSASKDSLNESLNKKIGALERTNFLENNCFC